ncbi:uncharacterized protein K02A2.6-like [Polistes fuscatus]|uniref:uncharacterized protein K02A2.6-like n=1 Tax=Polistes fuscatus TaxID=30207 RepID=UPI001CA808BD|nr:uncharacterized protein K02A2.6-like [Polistes fuscatus]
MDDDENSICQTDALKSKKAWLARIPPPGEYKKNENIEMYLVRLENWFKIKDAAARCNYPEAFFEEILLQKFASSIRNKRVVELVADEEITWETNHTAKDCRYAKFKCNCCDKVGHLMAVCKVTDKNRSFKKETKNIKIIELNQVLSSVNPKIKKIINVMGQPIEFEVDCGAEATRPQRQIMKKFGVIFNGNFEESIKDVLISIKLKDNVARAFSKPYELVISKRERVEDELKNYLRIEKNNYPLPLIDEIIAKVGHGKIFTVLNLKNAFLHLEVDEKSKELLTINTHKGLFRYNILPFGIGVAPTLFQEQLDKILSGLDNTAWYMDDINVIGCILPGKSKTKDLINSKIPETITELRSFLRFVNYYRKFVPNMSMLLNPLYELEKRGSILVGVLSVRRLLKITLSESEKKLPQIHKEALAIVDAVKRFHKYVYGYRFTLITDHQPLRSIFGENKGLPKHTINRLQHYAIFLQGDDCIFWNFRVVIPKSLQLKCLTLLHDQHIGSTRMRLLARKELWYPNMDRDIEDYVSSCKTCQIFENRNNKDTGLSNWPRQAIHWKEFIWIFTQRIESKNSSTVLRFLKQEIALFGYPHMIVSDNGPPLNSYELNDYFKAKKIQHVFSPPNHLQSNGIAERELERQRKE